MSALRLFPPTTPPLFALRVAPAPSGTATRCSASRQNNDEGEGQAGGSAPAVRFQSLGRHRSVGGEVELAGHLSRPTRRKEQLMSNTKAHKTRVVTPTARDATP